MGHYLPHNLLFCHGNLPDNAQCIDEEAHDLPCYAIAQLASCMYMWQCWHDSHLTYRFKQSPSRFPGWQESCKNLTPCFPSGYSKLVWKTSQDDTHKVTVRYLS